MITQTNESDPRTIHAQAIKFKSTRTQKSIFNNLITLYSKSESNSNLFLSYAHKIFHFQIPNPTASSWTSLISAFGKTTSSFTHFVSMLRHPVVPSQRTFAVVFKSCGYFSALSFGLQLHAVAAKLAVASLPFSGSSLISFYSKSGFFKDAGKVFDEMPKWDDVTFGSMIVGLAQNSRPVDAMLWFRKMRACNVRSTAYTVSGTVCAAARIMGLEQCRILHCHSVVTGLDQDLIVGTSLIDGYGKCGLVSDAREVFDELLSCMNVVGWNAMMAGYAQQGDSMLVLSLLTLMNRRGLVPDKYSFLAVLTSLANAGLIDETMKCLERMKTEYKVEPEIEHYTCLITVLTGAGKLEEAQKIATTVPFKLFNRTAKMAEMAEAKSWIEHQGRTHVFLPGDQSHYKKTEIYKMLEVLINKIEKLGYLASQVTNSEKMGHHSLKLALAFAVVSGGAATPPPGKAIRIMKNLRICADCHECFKLFSRVLDREIIVRDVNRYHRFVYGRCSCGDHW